MWTRRSFLQHGTVAVAALTCLRVKASQAARGPLGRPIGLQLYAVREAAAKDLPGTLQAIADIGYGEIELAGRPKQPVAQIRTLLADCGLAVPSMHAGMSELQKGAEQYIEYAKALGVEYLVCSFPGTADSRLTSLKAIATGMTLDDWKWNAQQLNRLGELAHKAGMRCGYHNHNLEFRSFDGVVAYDELLRLTDPALVTMELDIGWIVTAGRDPIAYLRKYADRISMMHIKDVRKDAQTTVEQVLTQTTEVGSGKIDWQGLFAATDSKHIRHYFVEQENFERNPLESAKISFDYLRRLGK
jgi:sugar phosphate isomerase/epimerase